MSTNMTIGKKIMSAFIGVAAVTLTVGAIGYYGAVTSQKAMTEVGAIRLPSVEHMLVISEAQSAVDGSENALLCRDLNSEGRQANYDRVAGAWQRVDEAWKVYEPLPQTVEEAKTWEKFVPAWEAWKKDHQEYVRLCKEYDKQLAAGADVNDIHKKMTEQALVTNGKTFSAAETLLNEIVVINTELGAATVTSSGSQASFLKTFTLIATLLGLVLAIVIGIIITRIITRPIIEVTKVAGNIALGDLNQKIDIVRKDEIGQLAEAFRSMIAALKAKVEVADKIANGDLSVELKAASEKDTLGKAMISLLESLRNMNAEVVSLTKAGVEGKLATRADASKHNGDFGKIVKGVNDTLDAVIGPLNVAAEYVDRISKGEIPARITDEYKGDFNEIKNNLNACVDAVNALTADANLLAKAAVEGKLATRADASKHNGDFGKIVKGVNDTLDAVIGPLNVAAEYVDRISKGDIPARITDEYNGDFNEIKNNLNACIDAVNSLVKDAGMLAQAAVEGKLDTRADASKHAGDYGKIVKGVNDTLDAVVGPINEAALVLKSAADKNLTQRVQGNYKGQLAELKDNINTTINTLDEALTQVAQAVDQVGSASGQISSGSQSLAEGANEQASSLEEISSSLEEMSSMTKQNSDNANQAKGLAGSAKDSAVKGTAAMTRMTDAITKIKTSSDQTAKIVKTIDEIAFQTNLLALNAAVEAARAGEAGKGFAVVAEEVRNLAQRSAEAARNTADMIEQSVKNAEGGVQITGEVARTLVEIADGAGKVNDLVAEIAAAAQEQSKGIEQVNTAVSQMDQVTQQNASNSEESASAAEELNSQAAELKNLVSKFELSSAKSGKEVSLAVNKVEHHLSFAAAEKPAGPKNRVRELVGAGSKTGLHETGKPVKSDGKSKDGNGGKKFRSESVLPLDESDLKDF